MACHSSVSGSPRRARSVAYSIPNFRATPRTDSRNACRSGDSIKLMRTPRWRSESAFADALYLPIRSQARSLGYLREGGEDRAHVDRAADRDGKRLDPAGPVGAHDMLHLHGLDDEQFLAG